MAPNHLIMIDNEVLYESDHEWHLIMIDNEVFFVNQIMNGT